MTKLFPRELAEWRAKYLQERFPRKGPCLIPKPGSCVPSCHENDFCECDMCEITGALYAKLLIDAPVFDEAEVARYIRATWFRNGADFSDRELATIISWLRWQHEQSAAQIAALRFNLDEAFKQIDAYRSNANVLTKRITDGEQEIAQLREKYK